MDYELAHLMFRAWLKDVLLDARVLCKDIELYQRLMRMV